MTRRKTPAKNTGMVRQRHGGALRRGNPGNRGGSGRPRANNSGADARYDALLEKYHKLVELVATMRQTGFAVTSAVKTARPSEDVERNAVQRAERRVISVNKNEFVANAQKGLEAEGVPAALAKKEAERMFQAATDVDPAP